MASPNNMQPLALSNSEKEPLRNSTLNTDDDDDEMPAITNAMYIAELKQQIAELKQQIVDLQQRIVDLQQRNVNLEQRNVNQMSFALVLVFFALMFCVLGAKTRFVNCTGMRLAYTYNDTTLRRLRYTTKVQDTNVWIALDSWWTESLLFWIPKYGVMVGAWSIFHYFKTCDLEL
ncbi:hypothetical protein BPOR_0996g00010 [Botrytis porri]|uniref:Uncharacterized protein n=2 Tax=Botrytis porri TaxID=87229 RepID=A0A4Z1KEA9_9HELO|nr:hypothetical protein BPOR_0996g00010 [Botrytis porri]